MNSKRLSILGIAIVMLSSCWKEEGAYILPAPPKDVVQKRIELGSNYDKIAYLNIKENSLIIKNLNDWDLAFQSGENEFYLKTNGGKPIAVFKTPNTDFDQPYAFIGGEEWKYDAASGNLDSTAIGKWWDATGKSENNVYLLNFGTDAKPKCRKLQIQKADATGYWIKIGDQNVPGGTEIFVPKKATKNYTHLNVNTGEIFTDFEPDKENWDLVFTRYTTGIPHDGGIKQYPVTGVLLNPNKVKAYMELTKTFEEIDMAYALSINYTDNDEVIGYEFKTYDQATGKYTTEKNRTYIVKTITGLYYKLRFIDYYSQNGVKGSPLFDMQQL